MLIRNSDKSISKLLGCLLGVACYGSIALTTDLLPQVSGFVAIGFGLLGLVELKPALANYRFYRKLTRPVFTQGDPSVSAGVNRWLGLGFRWEKSQRQQAEEIMKSDWQSKYETKVKVDTILKFLSENLRNGVCHPATLFKRLNQQIHCVSLAPGYPWIHLLGDEEPFYLTPNDLAGHMMVVGTTGAGKSRFLEHQIIQSIRRGDTVIVLDPKGDKALENNMKKACRVMGKDKHFIGIHIGDSTDSYGIDLLSNYSRVSELGSRIADTLPGQGGQGQVFVDMGRSILRTLCEGLEIAGKKPTFKRLHHAFLNRQEWAEQALESYLGVEFGRDAVVKLKPTSSKQSKYQAYKDFYLYSNAYDARIESIVNLTDRDQDHLMKTTVSTFNLLDTLVKGDLGEMLTPWDEADVGKRPFTDCRRIINQNAVLYVALDALSDSNVASTVGSMFLADLAALAGARYNFEKEHSPVMLFVDEAAELMCEPFVQMLNKSRGAGFSICLATQTVADFVSKAGNKKAEAMRILANLNNFVALRCNDQETQEFIVDRIPKTKIETTTFSHNVLLGDSSAASKAGSLGEQRNFEEVDLIPAQLLGTLPNFEFFAVVAGGHVIKGRFPLLKLSETA